MSKNFIKRNNPVSPTKDNTRLYRNLCGKVQRLDPDGFNEFAAEFARQTAADFVAQGGVDWNPPYEAAIRRARLRVAELKSGLVGAAEAYEEIMAAQEIYGER